ncbi:GNAT family N-acetyltransferase, partial [Acidimicrobium ferrooxidans]|nr:GNAT family N-acetyltransferase [Acidimicrobium ferrooxidans]
SRLYVGPDHWACGIGGLLHDHAVAHARDLGAKELNLWVLEANTRAWAMYERRGWTLVAGFKLENEPPEIVDVLYELVLD